MFGLVAAVILAASLTSARAEEWCGFLDKEHSQVRCGYSSATECRQSLSDNKDAVCIPDPSFAKYEDRNFAAKLKWPGAGPGHDKS
jgi:hypothetical protein